jgi:hypothetical protein
VNTPAKRPKKRPGATEDLQAAVAAAEEMVNELKESMGEQYLHLIEMDALVREKLFILQVCDWGSGREE